ncbi:unnamed protein product [Peniophora sp. CBMAI 1063]|nr:unnamed protein product [Peniophora sp. CBMAI 1063]
MSMPPVDEDGKVMCTCQRYCKGGTRIRPATWNKHAKDFPLSTLDGFLSALPPVDTANQQGQSEPRKRKHAAPGVNGPPPKRPRGPTGRNTPPATDPSVPPPSPNHAVEDEDNALPPTDADLRLDPDGGELGPREQAIGEPEEQGDTATDFSLGIRTWFGWKPTEGARTKNGQSLGEIEFGVVQPDASFDDSGMWTRPPSLVNAAILVTTRDIEQKLGVNDEGHAPTPPQI